jgi:hypothetical protein
MEEYLASDQLLTEIYHESLSLMYRLLFLFYAESRNLLPMDDEMYRETYSLESIRDDIISIHDDPDTKRFFGKGHADLWDRLRELFVFVNKGWRNVIPAYNGGLFDPDLHEFLERFKVDDYHLARAIDLLSRTKPRAGQARGEGRKKVTYRDLDIRHLGSIYEGILEYAAQIADHDLVVLKRGSGNKVYEEYVPVSQLKSKEKEQFKSWREATEENPENPKPPRGCRIMGKKTYGQYFLVYGGRESKRKSSGSYYTPDYIVQYIVENTLGPLVRGECRPKPEPLSEELKKLGIKDEPAPTGRLTSDEILELKVLDPAMGSGHFLVAATEYIARAYGEALIREGKDRDGVISDDEFIRYKRIVAERCIYGVDINPVAVELAKLSIWLFTMDKGRPLSFLDHHLKCGNSLIGAWIKDLGALPEFDKKGRPKKVEPEKVPATQMNLFETRFKEKLPLMIRDLLGIMKSETLTPDDIKLKKGLDKAVENIKRPFKNIADTWVGTYFGDEVRDYETLLSNVAVANDRKSTAAEQHRFFHWELEFPEVWFDVNGRRRENEGFNAVIGNPPYDVLEKERRGEARPHESLLHYIQCNSKYAGCIGGKINLYRPFLIQSINILGPSGVYCQIIPMSFMGDSTLSNTRKTIFRESQLLFIVAFPQKDDVNRRIFPDAKLSTCIVNLKKEIPLVNHQFRVFVYPGKSFDEMPVESQLSLEDITIIDPIFMPVPLASLHEIKVARKIHMSPKRLKDLANVTRGEINQTTFRQFITNNSAKKPMLKGVEIKMYGFNEVLSQGSREFFDEEMYEENHAKKRPPTVRIATQRITGVDEDRRLVCAISENGAYFADSTNSIVPKKLEFTSVLLGLLNSSLLNWRFSITSTNNNVSTKELELLPIPEGIYSDLIRDKIDELVKILQNSDYQGNADILKAKAYKELDRMTYQLYGLDETEIAVVGKKLELI